jgi:lipid II:glycine glycyltransferase (peptidoglycan interpeptide bridge formation enzyme)
MAAGQWLRNTATGDEALHFGPEKGPTIILPVIQVVSSVRNEITAAGWDEFSRRSPGGHILQSWGWGEFKARFGWPAPARLAVIEGDRFLAAAQVLFRPLPAGWWTTAYVPKGPLLDPAQPDAAAALLAAIHDTCRHRRAVSLKVEPDWEDTPDAHVWWRERGFRPSGRTVQPRRTVIVSLTPDEVSILAQMKSKTRYNIRLASRRGVSVRVGSAADLRGFYELLRVTSAREAFGIHTERYYAEVWQAFAAQGSAALFIAEYEGRPLAALMAFAWGGQAWYMYGASSNEERQRMPNHLLQWEAMRWAKGLGCETYDLWGIPDVDESQVGADVAQAEEDGVLSQGLGGLYRFKRSFGGREVRYVGAYDYVYSAPLYGLLTAAWNWRSA